jgi:hypothetical protein
MFDNRTLRDDMQQPNEKDSKMSDLGEAAVAEKKPKDTVTIVVDGAPHEVPKGKITFATVVTFAYPDYDPNSGVTYSVKYKRGPGSKPEGTLSPGGSVEVKEGMVFSVSRTGQS